MRQATHVSTPVTMDTEDARNLSMTNPSGGQTSDEKGSEREETIKAVWMTYGIVDPAKQQQMAKRIIRLVDDAYEGRPAPGRDEYLSVLKEAAKGMASRYRERKD